LQTPAHAPYPASQVTPHVALLQLGRAWATAGQILPQAPQLLGSLFTVTQAPAQFWLPVGQADVHLPPAHT
jgi:hypothetical protein